MNQLPDYNSNPQPRHDAGVPDSLRTRVESGVESRVENRIENHVDSGNDSSIGGGNNHRGAARRPVNVEHAHELLLSVPGMLQQTVIGQRRVIDDLLVAATAGGHVLVEGVPAWVKRYWFAALRSVLPVHLIAYSLPLT